MGYCRLRTVIWHSAISAGMVQGRESCFAGAGATFELIAQNRESGRLRQGGHCGKNKKSQGEIWHDIRVRRRRPIKYGVFGRVLPISGLFFAQGNAAAGECVC